MLKISLLATAIPAVLAASSDSPSPSSNPSACIVTEYSQLRPAVASCTAITLQDLAAPANKSIDLRGLQDGAKVTFAGTTTFAGVSARSDYKPIQVNGSGIAITGAAGHVIDGNGPVYWDGLGSNGGGDKPNWFFVIKGARDATVAGLQIRNWPVHGFQITGSQNVVLENIHMDNSGGDAPNDRSKGLAAAHNSDGFGVMASDFVTIRDCTVINQDDCWAATSGSHLTVSRLNCVNGHGLSVGSIGGKVNNTIRNVLIEDSILTNSSNGARIKTNMNTTGEVSDITFSNLQITGITGYGIDVQQDYLNAGPTGNPSNGVKISNIKFSNIKGTASGAKASNIFVLCGDGSCSNFAFENVDISGGGKGTRCNYPPEGCPGAATP